MNKIPTHIQKEISSAIEEGAEVSLLGEFQENETNTIIVKYDNGYIQLFQWFGEDRANDWQLIGLDKKVVKLLKKEIKNYG